MSSDDGWVLESLLGYLQSPFFDTPINEFIDQNCVVFGGEEENSLAHMEVFKGYSALINQLFESHVSEIGINEEQLAEALMQVLQSDVEREAFQQVLIADDFLSFKSVMSARNLQLEAEARRMLQEIAAYEKVESSKEAKDPVPEPQEGGAEEAEEEEEEEEEEEDEDEEARMLEEALALSLRSADEEASELTKEMEEMIAAAIQASQLENETMEVEIQREQADLEAAIAMSLAFEQQQKALAALAEQERLEEKARQEKQAEEELKKQQELERSAQEAKEQAEKEAAMEKAKQEKERIDRERELRAKAMEEKLRKQAEAEQKKKELLAQEMEEKQRYIEKMAARVEERRKKERQLMETAALKRNENVVALSGQAKQAHQEKVIDQRQKLLAKRQEEREMVLQKATELKTENGATPSKKETRNVLGLALAADLKRKLTMGQKKDAKKNVQDMSSQLDAVQRRKEEQERLEREREEMRKRLEEKRAREHEELAESLEANKFVIDDDF